VSNDYDATCRRMVHAAPGAFLPGLLRGEHAAIRHTGWIDTRRIPFPGHPDQTGDLVFELAETDGRNPPWAVPLEFQIEPDARMFGWLMTFLGTIVNERRPDDERGSEYQLLAIVVNLTGTRQSRPASRSFVWPGKRKSRKRLTFDLWEWHLADESAKATLAAIGRGRCDRAILPWVALMAGGSEPRNRQRWLELAEDEPDDDLRADLGYHTRVLVEKSADPEAWLKDLEGWGMIRSATMEATRREERRVAILDLVRLRTRGEVPLEVVRRIETCEDNDTLRAWFAVAAGIDTMEEFRQQTGL